MKPWRKEHCLSEIVSHGNITRDCKNKGLFNNPTRFFQHVYAFKDLCILHYAIFESLSIMYPKLVNNLLPSNEKKKILFSKKIPVSF